MWFLSSDWILIDLSEILEILGEKSFLLTRSRAVTLICFNLSLHALFLVPVICALVLSLNQIIRS